MIAVAIAPLPQAGWAVPPQVGAAREPPAPTSTMVTMRHDVIGAATARNRGEGAGRINRCSCAVAPGCRLGSVITTTGLT